MEVSHIRGGGKWQVGCNATVSVGSGSEIGYMGDVHYVNNIDVFGSLSTMSPPTMSPPPMPRHIEQTAGLPAQGIHILGVVQGNTASPTSFLGAGYASTLEHHSQDVAHTFSPPSQHNHAASPCKSDGRCQFGRGVSLWCPLWSILPQWAAVSRIHILMLNDKNLAQQGSQMEET